ncbi:MAG: hypothetical protein E6767_00745 [Dysgonomonas sp.]|nr:hypothetical protein [Dysgonomonas sp.]
MNSSNIFFLLLTIAIFFSACGDDNDDTGIYRYSSSSFTQYETLVGTDDHTGKPSTWIDTVNIRGLLTPTLSIFEVFTNTTISFNNDKILINNGTRTEKNTCEFSNDSLYIFNGNQKLFYGYQNRDSLIISQHYIIYKDDKEKWVQIKGPAKNKIEPEDAAKSIFGSLDNMETTDTLIWYSRKSIFL